MIRSHENPLALKAGAFTVIIHLALLAALLISFNTQEHQLPNIAQVELWDSLPTRTVKLVVVKEIFKPVLQEALKEEPKPELIIEKADIEIKKKPVQKPLEKTPHKLIEKNIVEKPAEKAKPNPTIEKKNQADALKALQDDVNADTSASDKKSAAKAKADAKVAADAQSAASASAASAGEIDKYKALIQAKIQRNVNKQLCGTGNPVLEFGIGLMPTGEVNGSPHMIKSSGLPACDDAVERAILQSQPLPLPPDTKLFSQFRELRLKFHPNDGN